VESDLGVPQISREVGADWQRLARALHVPEQDVRQIRQEMPGKEAISVMRIWIHQKGNDATVSVLDGALRKIGRNDIVRNVRTPQPGSSRESPPLTASWTGETRRVAPPVPPPRRRESSPPPPRYEEKPLSVLEEETVERETPASEVKTVVRSERHIIETDEGPEVNERTVTTTFEDGIAVNEHVVDRTVPLEPEEMRRLEQLRAESSARPTDFHSDDGGIHQRIHVSTEEEKDGGFVQTTTTTTTRRLDDDDEYEHEDGSTAGQLPP